MAGGRRAGGPELELRLLGPLEVVRGGVPSPLGGAKPRALLAVLALEARRAVSVDRLVEDLWPGEPPDTAPHAVQVYVSQLRKALGAETISRHGNGYALELDPERLDLGRFTRLVGEGRGALAGGDPAAATTLLGEALALWRGPALADFTYEPFAQAEIARLDDLRLDALEARIDADLALGRHLDLVPELEALVHAHPLREHPRAQLMLALYRSGRQADALAAYRAARDILVEELGLDPGLELRELEAGILRQHESLLLPESAVVPAMQYRRLVTILFVDVVGSMELAAKLDPEALSSVLGAYFDSVSASVTRHGGTVEKFAGDAVMAVFGIPVSHEDDALRAARAALEAREAIAALSERVAHDHDIELQVRMGLDAGEVVASSTDARQRLVAGQAVGVASRLEQVAAPGEVVVGELAARLIDHVAALDPIGEVELEGVRDPVRAYRLTGLTAVPPVYAQQAEAPFVGRVRELALLRKALKSARTASAPRAALVVGAAGTGKTRLVAELARRARGTRTLWGRCLSYGEGITYWPLREALARAPESEEREALLEALAAEPPPPAAETALLFRRFCEAMAREKPLVVVFDDVHWAEATLLELIEHVVDRGEGPILVACLARTELLEERPAFLEDAEHVDRLHLEPLHPDEAESVLDALAGGVLETERRARIVERAEGNPLFLQQLLALALEGGLATEALPPTVQAVLAARLDRLGPGERAVLERGAVVGKEFTADDVTALLAPEAIPTAATHLEGLAERGFVRPLGDEAFAFRHILVREAVYRAAPKRLRAELHERFADRLDSAYPELPDLDEFVGYHLEQAYRLRAELSESDRRVESLAGDAGRRLGDAGYRALKRGDMPATVNLLTRATALLTVENARRLELMSELGIGQRASGDAEGASATLRQAISDAIVAGDRRAELRARLENAYIDLLTEPKGAARELLSLAEDALGTFEALEDDRSLARAWLLTGYVRGGIHGDHAAWLEAEEQALKYYRSASFPPATCLAQIAAALYWGPTPVPEAVERCAHLLVAEALGLTDRAAVMPFLGGLEAQLGHVSRARELVAEADGIYRDLGWPEAAAIRCGTILADIELLANDYSAAETTLREQCEFFKKMADRSHLAVRAAKLADALLRQGRFEEAGDWAAISRSNAAADDQSAQLVLRSVDARLLARRGLVADARALAEDTVRLADSTDGLNQAANARLALAEVLRADGLLDEGDRAIEDAIQIFERKGNIVGASNASDLLGVEIPA